ncbi:hypothetical protein AWU65_04600 [Paenibacillus glucanolyticus]|uniref:Uncharacterized protein n=1 Tax=Paenibacillus glucanolyticus TaxID=59843 RepID=A0A163H1A9_9BACL|nr:tail fiber protein [Paenibacillus glucanolyticus]KZS45260.1 hypothetical protein AWU65_04600 [Paenibacillus glucanolyticus]
MSSNTPNLGLLKKDPMVDGNETFNIETMLNENWDKVDEAVGNIKVPDASLTEKGIVQLSSATNGTRENVAATEKAVKAAYDEALAGKQYTDQRVNGINKAHVGLGNVENYGIASQAEAEAGTVENKYMTPMRTAQAIARRAIGQRSATIVIAASNATETSKKGADYVCTGVNDEDVINDAMYYGLPVGGGEVVLTEGAFVVGSRSIAIPSNTTFRGAGFGTIIKLRDNASNNVTLLTNEDTSSGNGGDITVCDLVLEGNTANNPTRGAGGLSFSNGEHFIIQRVLIRNMKHEILRVSDSRYNLILGNIIRNNSASSSNSVDLSSTGFSTVSNNIVADNGTTGVYGGNHLNITDNIFIGAYDAVDLRSTGTRVAGNLIFSSLRNGISIDSAASYNTVQNNTVRFSAQNGIRIHYQAQGNFVTNNDLYNSGSTAFFDQGTGTIITAGNRT